MHKPLKRATLPNDCVTSVNNLADNECNYQSAFRDTDGSLYFGSIKGVTRIVPRLLTEQFSAHRRLVVARITHYLDQDTLPHPVYPNALAPGPLLLTDGDQATVHVALTDYLSPENTHYHYQLQGLADTAWHQLTTQHTVRLLHLPAGNYTLLLKAESATGVPATNVVALPVQVRYTWWRHPLAWVAAGLLLAFMLGWYVRHSRRQHRRQQLQLRQRLAHDLHDELGALLVRASLQAELLKGEVLNGEQESAGTTANQLIGNLQGASLAMRDIAWGIDPHANTLGDLLDRLREYVAQLTVPAQVQVEFQAAAVQADQPLQPLLRQHVYAILKEAITNSLRHARHSSQLTVTFAQLPHQLELSIVDNGQGATAPGRSGIGLRSMQQRAQVLGGKLEAGPRPEGGFGVWLTVPLPG